MKTVLEISDVKQAVSQHDISLFDLIGLLREEITYYSINEEKVNYVKRALNEIEEILESRYK